MGRHGTAVATTSGVNVTDAQECGTQVPVDDSLPGTNEVVLTGRVSGEPDCRELPSGDSVVQLRVVVRRGPPRPRAGRPGPTVDTIDLSCWTSALRRKAIRLHDGEPVTVRGALRRRFWRTPAGPASRYEVEVTSLDRGGSTRADDGPG